MPYRPKFLQFLGKAYNTGYLFKTGGSAWTPVPYTSTEQLIANAWYPKTANATIAMTTAELANPSYVLGYICSWTGGAWNRFHE
jgi:hypothetical protein